MRQALTQRVRQQSEAEQRQNRASPETPAPWTETIESLVQFVVDGRGDEGAGTVAFGHVFDHIVAFASSRIEWDQRPMVTSGAVAGFEDALRDRLQPLYAHPLFIEFKFSMQSDDRPTVESDGERGGYNSFVDWFTTGGIEEFLTEYAWLARLTEMTLTQWERWVCEFLDALERDRDGLSERFDLPESTRVTDVTQYGDEHDGGRCVLGATFGSGDRLVYKPHPTAPAEWFNRAIGWLNDRLPTTEIETVAVWSRDDHGWMEWAGDGDCSDEAGARRYYERAGALLCLAYATRTTDVHFENLVAAAEHPVLVDLETVATPTVRSARSPTDGQVRESVLWTGAVPMFEPEASMSHTAGLGVAPAIDSERHRIAFDNPNTDEMELRYQARIEQEGRNVPTVDGVAVPPEDHADALVRGFEAAYDCLLDHADSFGEVVDGIEELDVRVLCRQTRTYQRIRQSARESQALRTGEPYREQLAELDDEQDPLKPPIVAAERQALARYDVPRFVVAGDETVVRHGDETLAQVTNETPAQQVRDRVDALSPDDRDAQVSLIRTAFDPEAMSHPTPTVSGTEAVPSDDELKRVAQELHDRIRAAATQADGSPEWVIRNRRSTGSGEGVNIHGLRPDLYGGRLGVAVFGAALQTVTGAESPLVRDVTEPLVQRFSEEDDPFAELSVGVGKGLGALVYGFTKLAQLTGDDRYLETAKRAHELITPDRIAADDTYDLLDGSAGAILGSLALGRFDGDDAALDTARTAGDHLLDAALDRSTGVTWRTITNRPLCGVSHGTGGIAYALGSLAAATGESRFRDGARAGIAFENAQFASERGSWPDRRPDSPDQFTDGWCSGAAGIGTTRLALTEQENDLAYGTDVRRALDRVGETGPMDRDHPCCGSAGRAEFLLAADRSGAIQTSHGRAAERTFGRVVSGLRERGRLVLPWHDEHWSTPGLFVGQAGVGYTALRFVDPSLPNLLQFE